MVTASSVNITYTRGDVVLCDLNPVVGTEQAGIRPVVILQIDKSRIIRVIGHLDENYMNGLAVALGVILGL